MQILNVTSSCVLLAPFGFFLPDLKKERKSHEKFEKKIRRPVCTCLRSFPVEVYLLVIFCFLFSFSYKLLYKYVRYRSPVYEGYGFHRPG